VETLLKLDGVSKRFPGKAGNRFGGLLRALMGVPAKTGHAVLSDIDLSVKQGESLALIGQNGAGKSTLLKLIAGVLRPSEGTVVVKTSIGSLLELGAGFDEDLSGWQNLKQSAEIMNIEGQDAQAVIEQAISFADLGDKLKYPIKTYSSGMVVRLGFGFMSALKPGLLITDEVLAVGDESFQAKCTQWIESYLNDGGTLLLVSHSPYQVQKLCQKAIWLDQGRIKMSGDAFEVSQAYSDTLTSVDNQSGKNQIGQVRISQLTHHANLNSLDFKLQLDSAAQLPQRVGLAVQANDGSVVCTEEIQMLACDQGFQWNTQGLMPGQYFFYAGIKQKNSQLIPINRPFRITGQSRALGTLNLKREWKTGA